MNFKHEVASKISSVTDLNIDIIYNLIEIPPDPSLGDFAFPCFQLSKIYKKSPESIAAEIADKLIKKNDKIFQLITPIKGYLNLFIDKSIYLNNVISEIINLDDRYGSSNIGEGKTIIVEFSSPNIAKPFHVGHLCSTLIGNSLEKIYKFLGYKTIKINHLGDWGTQFGKLITAYKHWGKEENLKEEPIKALLDLYVKFHHEAKNNKTLNEEARLNFKKLEEGDPDAIALWQKFRLLSLKEFKKIYSLLNIEFDSYEGESFYSDKLETVIELLKEKNLLQISENAVIVNLEHLNMPPCIIVKSDGASIYATRDIAAAIYRKLTYDFERCIYVVGTPQALHFKQFFSVLKMMGYNWANSLIHVGFGLVKFTDRKLSTRTGDVIFLEDVLKESINKALKIINNKNPNLPDKEGIAKKVGIGSVIYTFLKNNRERDIIFSWDETLNFDGESGPYIQYTYVRCQSILRKSNLNTLQANYELLNSPEEIELVKLLDNFKEKIVEAAERYEPSIITRHITEICKSFNRFYRNISILKTDNNNLKIARINLTKSVSIVLKVGLNLLGIEVTENM